MKCPVCTTVNLVMSERQGIEIDYCPDCRGVWLDRGELDKIIERAVPQESVQPTPPPQQPQYAPQPNAYANAPAPGYGQGNPHGQYQNQNQGNPHGQYQNQNHGQHHGQKPYRKKSFLEELFD